MATRASGVDALEGHAGPLPRVPRAPSPAETCAWAKTMHRVMPAPSGPGHRLYWATEGTFGARELVAGPGAFFIVGRHTTCDVLFDLDPGISLRHLLVRSEVLSDGCLVLSILELDTREGFVIAGTRHHSVAVTGPVVLQVGAYVLVAVPSGEAPPAPTDAPELRRVHPYREPPRRALGRSVLTDLQAAIDLSAPASSREPPRGERHELRVGKSGLWAHVPLSDPELERGVLVGRDLRCIDSGARQFVTMGISRVHVCILKTARGIFAFDTASTQGIYQGGAAVRQVRLEEGTELVLGVHGSMNLSWR